MKKTTFLPFIILVLSFCLFSCRKDEIPSGKEIYIGEWYSFHYDQTVKINVDGTGSFETQSRHYNGKVHFSDSQFEIISTFKTNTFIINQTPSNITPGAFPTTGYSMQAIFNGGYFYKRD